MSNIKTICTVALTAYIAILTTLMYSLVGTIPVNDEPVGFGVVIQFLGVLVLPAILGILIGIEIGEEQ